jgi:hypothetical protein
MGHLPGFGVVSSMVLPRIYPQEKVYPQADQDRPVGGGDYLVLAG